MFETKSFVYITSADLIVRSAYQMGKTPLLPLFAAALGVGDAFLGLIVSVSTVTGMLLKPLIGFLSDRWGRRLWLIIGTTFFAVIPFVYRFIHTPEQLFVLRIIHGCATAIYGPVTLAYVAEQSKLRRAERLAWFGNARNAGYIIGPAVAGWMLLYTDPVSVYTIVGFISCCAFLPVLLMSDSSSNFIERRGAIMTDVVKALLAGGRTGSVWLAGGMEAATFMSLYATKAFLPIFAIAAGFNVGLVGIFFAMQEAVHIILNPIGGRIGDRFGYSLAVPLGMMVLAISLPITPVAETAVVLMCLAVLMGAAQALVFPSTISMVSSDIQDGNVATGMGLVGTMKNAGKVLGPIVAGGLIHTFDYTMTFQLFGLVMLLSAAFVWLQAWIAPRVLKT